MYYILCVYGGGGGKPWCMCGGQSTTFRSGFSSSTRWDLGIELRSLGFATSALILQAILLARMSKISDLIRLNGILITITDIHWAGAVGELSNLPGLFLLTLQSILWVGNFIFISLPPVQVKNEVQGNCVIFL